jgi:RHH-type transcriptional regulator, rel operon repressor / antitoxin RelB
MRTLTVRIDDEIEQRLKRLATNTNRTKSYYVREAIIGALDNLEDVYLADQVIARIRMGKEKTRTMEEVEARLVLND